MKNFYLIIFLCALMIFPSGCTGIIVSKGKEPTSVEKKPIERSEKPYETTTEWIPTQVEIRNNVPKDIPLDQLELKLSKRRTVIVIKQELVRNGWKVMTFPFPIRANVEGGKGRYRYGILAPYEPFLVEILPPENKQQIKVRLVKALMCGNRIENTVVAINPGHFVTRERYIDKEVIVKRYTDVDYTPAIPAFLLGMLGGVAIGYGIWHHAKTVYQVIPKGGEPCGPGSPAPR